MHNFFRRNHNHFRELEEAAEAFWQGAAPETDEIYSYLKLRLKQALGIAVRVVPVGGAAATRCAATTSGPARSCSARRSTTPTASSSWCT